MKRAQGKPAFDLTSASERLSLADLIVKASRTLKSPRGVVSYDELKAKWDGYRREYWDRHRIESSDRETDWDKLEADSLEDCLIELRRRQMVFQGHRWTCHKCHHRNWVDIAALAPDLSCEVCKQHVQAPVNIPWLFRPNEFLIESLRDRSVLSLVWVLSALFAKSRTSFIFVEPTQFGFSESSMPSAEADLLVILDGEAIVCEVKSSWHGLRPSDVKAFVDLARRLRPDIALLAVMETGEGLKAELDTARAQLESEQIKFELLTPDRYQLQDRPYLTFGEEE
jgi:hypothetical protein